MSDGDPYKRQKTSEEGEVTALNDTNLKYQNACLAIRLKDQRKQISELTSTNAKLSIKQKELEETLTNFNCSWAKVKIN